MKGITVCCDGEKSLRKELAQIASGKDKEENALKLLQLLWGQSLRKTRKKKRRLANLK